MSKDIKFNFLNSDEEERYQKHFTLKEIGYEGQLYLKKLYISEHLKKYKMFRFGILHNKKVVNRRFFRYCLVHILSLLNS